MGSAPIAPFSNTHLIKVNSSSIVLNLAAWLDGGCPITSFVVEYQKIRRRINNLNKETLENEVTISIGDHQYSGNFSATTNHVRST